MFKEYKEEIVMIVGTIIMLMLTVYFFSMQASDPRTFSSVGKMLIDLVFRTLYILLKFLLSAGQG